MPPSTSSPPAEQQKAVGQQHHLPAAELVHQHPEGDAAQAVEYRQQQPQHRRRAVIGGDLGRGVNDQQAGCTHEHVPQEEQPEGGPADHLAGGVVPLFLHLGSGGRRGQDRPRSGQAHHGTAQGQHHGDDYCEGPE